MPAAAADINGYDLDQGLPDEYYVFFNAAQPPSAESRAVPLDEWHRDLDRELHNKKRELLADEYQAYLEDRERVHAAQNPAPAPRPVLTAAEVDEAINLEIGSPEYHQRIDRIRAAYRALDESDTPPLPLPTCIEDAEAIAIRIVWLLQKSQYMYDLIGDVSYCTSKRRRDLLEDYKPPHERAPDYIPHDHADRDPVPMDVYFRRVHSKIMHNLNSHLDRAYAKETDNVLIRNLALAAMTTKVVRQSMSPSRKRERGRPITTGARMLREIEREPSTLGGARPGAGRKPGGRNRRKSIELHSAKLEWQEEV